MHDAQKVALVDFLALKLGCNYPSELHYLSELECCTLKNIIQEIPTENFDLWQWQDAYCYLTGQKSEESDAENVKQRLIREKWN